MSSQIEKEHMYLPSNKIKKRMLSFIHGVGDRELHVG